MVNVPTWIRKCDFQSPALLDLFISLDAINCSSTAFLRLGNSNNISVSVSDDFPSNSMSNDLFHRIIYDYSRTDWDGLLDHLRDNPWEDKLRLTLLIWYCC